MDYQEVELVFISDTESEDENNELTTYSYINNGYCYEYFVGYEVAALLGYANPKNVITNNVSKCNQLVFRDYPGVKDPDLDPRTILITRDGAVEILLKTRKRITPDVLHILKTFGIETTNRKCLTKEQQCLLSITNTFKTEKFEDQYKVDCYYIDLYFPDYYNECINCYNQDSLQCNRCHEIKDKEKCFSKDSTKKTGYRTICKKCTNN